MTPPPGDLRGQCLQVREELEFLMDTWYTCGVLFRGVHVEGQETLALLNRTSTPFFLRVQVIFAREVALGLCRLLDPARSHKGDPNLSLFRLLEHPAVPAPARQRGMDQLAGIATDAAALRTLRHKRLAHSDEAVGLLPPAAQWDSVETAMVERVFRAVRDAFAQVTDSTGMPGVRGHGESMFSRHHGIHALLNALRAADPGAGYRWTRDGVGPEDKTGP